VVSKIVFICLYTKYGHLLLLDLPDIFCYWTYQRAKSQPEQQTRTFFKHLSQTRSDLFGFVKNVVK